MPEIQTILITGANGQLGRSLNAIMGEYPQYTATFADRKMLDLSKPSTIESFFAVNTFDLIINCAAYTAVDKAESEPELADRINHLAVKQLAKIAAQQQAKLIHISTDYVFNGKQYKPYVETDAVDPQNVYGQTKLAGEQAILKIMPKNAMIIRTSWVYSEYGNNFVKTMLKLGAERDSLSVVCDQVGTPTYAGDLARAVMTITGSEPFKQQDIDSQCYHYSNEGICSWYDFAKAVFEIAGVKCNVNPIESKDYPTAAKRPYYSVLNKRMIKQHFEVEVPYWKESCASICKVNKLTDVTHSPRILEKI
jgi:dTDP-4-dehydrorhamnose reductase